MRRHIQHFLAGLGLLVIMQLFFSCSPDHAGEALIRSYESQKGVVTFKLPPALVGSILAQEDMEMKEMFRNMESIKFILVDMGRAGAETNSEFAGEFEDRLESIGFETMLMTNSEGQAIHILILEDDRDGSLQITEMMILITGEEEFLGLSLVGDIEPEKMIEAAKEMQIGDFNLK